MDQPHLQQLLADLHAELRSVRSFDPKTRELLQRLTEDLRPIVEAGPTPPTTVHYRGLRERLAEATTGFEVSHPQLAKTIANAVDTLALLNL